MSVQPLIIEGARQNNLKNINLTLPHNSFIVITGVSGSGKSSLAFDTLFAEGQWRFIESLSTYARLFIEKLNRPDVDSLKNLRPAIALEQRNPVKTSRSTVGTTTEVYDYLRLLFSKIGRPHCPHCGVTLKRWSPSEIVQEMVQHHRDERGLIIFQSSEEAEKLKRKGFHRFRSNGRMVESGEELSGPLEVILDRIIIKDEQRLSDSIETAWVEGKGKVIVEILDKGTFIFSSKLACNVCDFEMTSPNPLLFSFNHPTGACPMCKGFGDNLQYVVEKIVPNQELSLKEMAIEPWSKPSYRWWYRQFIKGAKYSGVDIEVPFKNLPKSKKDLIFEGNEAFYGVNDFFDTLEEKKYKLHVRVFLSKYRQPVKCSQCKGTRLKPETLAFRVSGMNIQEVTRMSISRLSDFLENIRISDHEKLISEEILRQIRLKLTFLKRVGLGYLTMDRLSKTLSGGESQRIKLSNQLASRLTGTLYVLDEPTIGLHSADVSKIIAIMKELSSIGNTLVVVEHDNAVISSAEWVVEIGPWSGSKGGNVVFSGPFSSFVNNDSLTAKYLQGIESIPKKVKRRKGFGFLRIVGCHGNNLKHIDVNLPLQTMICVTGVSGSGKSTLVNDTIYRALAEKMKIEFLKPAPFDSMEGHEFLKGVNIIDQSPVGKSPRSNPLTYTKAFDGIRKFFSTLPEAKYFGFGPGHFSFNTEEGRCHTCKGEGFIKLEMYFFENIYIRCEECDGKRFKNEILEVTYRGKNIHDVLELTVDEAIDFFSEIAGTHKRLKLLKSVGLDYLKLGQPLTTLSGGEAQRLKICAELGISKRKNYLYILDEPSVGLHTHDIKKLLILLDKLVNAGNTVIMVEHNLDIIKHADWILDLGPGGGEQGGEIVASGTPEILIESKQSMTGRFLRNHCMKLP